MAIKNVGGHGVTSVLKGTDHVVANASQPNFVPNTGEAGYKGPKGKGGKKAPYAK